MTLKDVEIAVKEIREMAWDDEAAHTSEDALRTKFIEYVATSGVVGYAEMARLVLITAEIGFKRWCA